VIKYIDQTIIPMNFNGPVLGNDSPQQRQRALWSLDFKTATPNGAKNREWWRDGHHSTRKKSYNHFNNSEAVQLS